MSEPDESDEIGKLLADNAKREKETQKRRRDNKKRRKKLRNELEEISKNKKIYDNMIPKYVAEMDDMIHYAGLSYNNMPSESASILEEEILQDLECRINGVHAKINLDYHKIEYRKYWLAMIGFICSRIWSWFKGW